MTLTQAQQRIRAKHVTASEVPALFGEDPYQTAGDLWLLKTGRVPVISRPNEASDIGLMIEDSLIRWAGDELDVKVSRRNPLRVHTDGILSCTHDALVVNEPVAIQAKTAGILNPFASRDSWGEAGTDQVSNRVNLQCQAEMAVSDLDRVFVPAMIGGRGRLLYIVQRSEIIVEAIICRAREFWMAVEADERPVDWVPSLDVVKRLRREPGTVKAIDTKLVETWRTNKELAKKFKEAAEESEAKIRADIGEAEAGECDLGQVLRQQISRKAYTVKETTYEQLKFTERK